MIVFVDKKTVKRDGLIITNPEATFVGISDEVKGDWLTMGKHLLPPPDILGMYIESGDKDRYRMDYWRYLTDPRVRYMLLLNVYQASTELLFFVHSEYEKELKYPKYLREFIIESLNVDSKYVITYKKFSKNKQMSNKEINGIRLLLEDARSKAREACDVLEGGL